MEIYSRHDKQWKVLYIDQKDKMVKLQAVSDQETIIIDKERFNEEFTKDAEDTTERPP